MSGTSLDGIDFVYVRFDANHYANFEILEATTISYSAEWKLKLQNAISFSANALEQLDLDYGKFLGEKTNDFIREFNIGAIDFIASHGHTVLHQPAKGITLQVGNGQVLTNMTKQQVICDFRTQDVQLGGQGAPLVPIGDALLFSEYDYCLNLGGFANVSFKKGGERIAYDICPVNIVLNHYVKKLGLEFDDSGKIASTGKINSDLLAKLNQLEFYQKDSPKSLGLEWVKSHIFPLIDKLETDISVILRTFVEHVATQISNSIKPGTSVLSTGGGAYHTFLMGRIQELLHTEIVLPSPKLIDFKEALIFAFLGLLRTKNENNCLKTVTGASKDHSSGVVFYPKDI
jgi:anhydro-N-acetylmuramic acid kinase